MMTFSTRMGEGQGRTKKGRKATKSEGSGLEEGASHILGERFVKNGFLFLRFPTAFKDINGRQALNQGVCVRVWSRQGLGAMEFKGTCGPMYR